MLDSLDLTLSLYSNYLWLTWAIGFSLAFGILKRSERYKPMYSYKTMHQLSYWLLTAVTTLCVFQSINASSHEQYRLLSLLLIPTLFQALIHLLKKRWPFKAYHYFETVSPPLIAWIFSYSIIIHCFQPQLAVYFLPILNPLGLGLGLGFTLLIITQYFESNRKWIKMHLNQLEPRLLLGVLYFI